jgi:hypothetical protein
MGSNRTSGLRVRPRNCYGERSWPPHPPQRSRRLSRTEPPKPPSSARPSDAEVEPVHPCYGHRKIGTKRGRPRASVSHSLAAVPDSQGARSWRTSCCHSPRHRRRQRCAQQRQARSGSAKSASGCNPGCSSLGSACFCANLYAQVRTPADFDEQHGSGLILVEAGSSPPALPHGVCP